MIFRSFFSTDGFINVLLINANIISEPVSWLTDHFWVRFVIILIITWRWTGYDVIFYLAGLQGIETSIYEAARIDGASSVQQFFYITLPLLKPVILFTAIMSTNGTLQLYDEVQVIAPTGLISTITISQYIFRTAFGGVPQLGYASAISFFVLILVAVLSFIQLKIGDRA